MKEKVKMYLSIRGAEPDHKIQVVFKNKFGELAYKQMTIEEILIEFDSFKWPITTNQTTN